jgi:hypothetical protein
MAVHSSTCQFLSRSMAVHNGIWQYSFQSVTVYGSTWRHDGGTLTGFALVGAASRFWCAFESVALHAQSVAIASSHCMHKLVYSSFDSLACGFKCSRCDTIFADPISLTPNSEHCKQHCNQTGLPLVITGAGPVRTVTFARLPVESCFEKQTGISRGVACVELREA